MTNLIEGELIVSSDNLKVLVKKINTSYKKSINHATKALECAVETGEYLIEAQQEVYVKNGKQVGWEKWLNEQTIVSSEETIFNRNQANKYIKLAKNKHLALIQSGDVFNLNHSLADLKDATEEQKAEAVEIEEEEVVMKSVAKTLQSEYGVTEGNSNKMVTKHKKLLGVPFKTKISDEVYEQVLGACVKEIENKKAKEAKKEKVIKKQDEEISNNFIADFISTASTDDLFAMMDAILAKSMVDIGSIETHNRLARLPAMTSRGILIGALSKANKEDPTVHNFTLGE
ncbi:MAG: hypothetical protein DRQ42_07090 [Gammaproteobacteria bacterium]|nr:MAG: hypothetical protein DRQ42_07090 [Gammaproteobacteria bacterium]